MGKWEEEEEWDGMKEEEGGKKEKEEKREKKERDGSMYHCEGVGGKMGEREREREERDEEMEGNRKNTISRGITHNKGKVYNIISTVKIEPR